jgi:L-ascorbate metabolism protein UlaG (beta-lactamase superfamily)
MDVLGPGAGGSLPLPIEEAPMIDDIHWLGHDSFRFDGPVTIYVDPWKLAPGSPPADLILITHEHHDHFSQDDIALIRTPDTEIVTIATVAKALTGQVHVVQAGDELTVKGVDIQVLPAYNKTKQYHPRSKGHVGYVITLGGQRIYHAGDTDAIPEMRGLKPDVALVPVSGTYVMDVYEALEALKLIEPAMAVPMHYGDIVGTDQDAARFQDLSPVPVNVLPSER